MNNKKRGINTTKLDAALRQLETAIILWFNEADALSIHTLVSAAYQLLYDLNKHYNGPPMVPDSELIKPERRKEVRAALKKWANFLKHADNDPSETIFFNPDSNKFLLLEAAHQYLILTKEARPILHCFRIWFASAHPDLFESEFIDRVQKAIPPDYFMRMTKIQFFNETLPIFTNGIISEHKPPK